MTTPQPEPTQPTLKDRFQDLLAEYGPIAIVIHFTLFFGSVFAFWVAIGMGVDVGGDASSAPEWLIGSGSARLVAAYVASQLIKPLRLGLVLVLTPAVAKLLRREAKSTETDAPLGSIEEPGQLEN